MNKKGITLIELLVVVAIIGILTAIAIPAYIGQQRKAARTEGSSNLENIRLLEEQFFSDNGRYAPDPDGTVKYDTSVVTLQTTLPGFKPGDAEDLNYTYEVTTAGTGASFTATAKARSGKRVTGDADCTINQDNIRSGPCW